MAFPNKPIPDEVYGLFKNVMELVKRRLAESLFQSKPLSRPIVIKLVNLGDSEATAKPFIVIICDKSTGAKARHIVKETWYKEHCRDREGNRPPLETIVYDREDGAKFCTTDGLEIYFPCRSRHTINFGRLMKFHDGLDDRMVTLGGILHVLGVSGTENYYALTCGHHLYKAPPEGEQPKKALDVSASIPDESLEIEEIDNDIDDSMEIEYEFLWDDPDDSPVEPTELTPSDTLVADKHLLVPSCGKIVASSYDPDSRTPNLDWALVELDPPAECLSIVSEFYWKLSILNLSRNRVHVFAGIVSGILSQQDSLLLAPGSHNFIDVKSLSDLDVPLDHGDSGAWVVNGATKEVIGQLVACGPFGDYYVIPMNQIMGCIEKQLDAYQVNIATEYEVKKWVGKDGTEDAIKMAAQPPGGLDHFSTPHLTVELGTFKPAVAESMIGYIDSVKKWPKGPYDSGYASQSSTALTSRNHSEHSQL